MLARIFVVGARNCTADIDIVRVRACPWGDHMAHSLVQARRTRRAESARVVALDGLRAIAVILVIAYHAGQLRFGWIGVPVFFALSGHFITRILVGKRAGSRRTRAWNFFRNRALRLAPLYYAACLALSALAIKGYGPKELRGDLPFLWTWTYNLRGLFPGYSDNPLYDHTWSLGVEVQLYIVWAALAFSLPRRWFVRVVVGLVFAGPVIRLAVWWGLIAAGFSHTSRLDLTYMLPTTYLDVFAIGGCTALPEVRQFLGGAWRWLAAAVGVTIVCGVIDIFTAPRFPADLGYTSEMPQNLGWIWGYSVVALLAGTIILLLLEGGRAAELLSARPLVRIGIVSYGVYLLHRPILRVVQEHLTHWAHPWTPVAVLGTVVAIGLTIAAAEMSFRFLESPFMARKRGSLVAAPPAVVTPAQGEALVEDPA
jgi:peptidoglycan/LPS O-acetylase OafA/YrhL